MHLHAPTTRRNATGAQAGFTLLEVMIAIAIVALSFTVLIGAQSRSTQNGQQANALARAAMLAKSKMFDIEGEQLAEGFALDADEMRGDFRDEGFPDIEWEATVEPVELGDDASAVFQQQAMGQLYGGAEGDGGALTGAQGVSQMLPMILGFVPQIVNEVGERLRRVTLTVRWNDLVGDRELTVAQYIVDLEPKEGTDEMQDAAEDAIIDAVMNSGDAP